MKNLLTILAVTLICQVSYSQVDVTIRPLAILYGNVNIGADVTLSQGFSTELRLGVFSTSVATKFYLNPKTRTDGFYLGGFTNYSFLDERGGVGFLLGGKARSKRRFLFDANLGFGRAIIDTYTGDLSDFLGFPNLVVIGKVSVGWRIGSCSSSQPSLLI